MTCGRTKTIERLLAGTFVFGLVFGAFASAQDRMPPIPADKLTPAQKRLLMSTKRNAAGSPAARGPVVRRENRRGINESQNVEIDFAPDGRPPGGTRKRDAVAITD